MSKRRYWLVAIFIVFVLLIIVLLGLLVDNQARFIVQTPSALSLAHLLRTKRTNKTFLWLLQTRSCLPLHMAEMSALGDPATCDCDILVLSFKSKCTFSQFPHVFYMFNTSVTWTTGRTELYNTAIKLNRQYLYYIFSDDDIVPKWTYTRRSENVWRYFEQFLRRIEPPLAALDNEDWSLIHHIVTKRQLNRCTLNGTYPEYFLAKWFDAETNAFHYRAIDHILKPVLPYWHRFDKESWWFSQWYVNFMTDIVFHKQAVLLSQIIGSNSAHNDYPKHSHSSQTLYMIASDVNDLIPKQHQDAAAHLLKDWVNKYVNILQTVEDTYCHLIPSPHEKLEPYKRLYLTGKST